MARGQKTGGRQKGTPNRATVARQQEVSASGLTPLDYMLSIMRDEQNPKDMRLDAAYKAAPFVHPKLASIEHSGPNGGPIPVAAVELSDDELAAIAAGRGSGAPEAS